MVERFLNRLARGFDIAEIGYPAKLWVKRPRDVNADLKRVPMQPRALVPLGHIRQAMGGFNGEVLEDFHEG